MKKKLLLAMLVGMLGVAGLVTGCSGGKTEDKKTETAEEKEPELKVIGTESKDAFKVELKNSTAKNITGVSVKLTEETEYPANMLANGDVFAVDESRNLYYTAPAAAEETAETADASADEKVLTQGYDIQLTFEDGTTAELHSFPFEDMEAGEICFADEVAYLSYTSVATEDKVETKEAELAVKAAKEAEAQKAAEEAAAAEAAAQAAAEQAAAEAAAQETYDDSYYDYSYDSGYTEPAAPAAGGDDACLGDGLTY